MQKQKSLLFNYPNTLIYSSAQKEDLIGVLLACLTSTRVHCVQISSFCFAKQTVFSSWLWILLFGNGTSKRRAYHTRICFDFRLFNIQCVCDYKKEEISNYYDCYLIKNEQFLFVCYWYVTSSTSSAEHNTSYFLFYYVNSIVSHRVCLLVCWLLLLLADFQLGHFDFVIVLGFYVCRLERTIA